MRIPKKYGQSRVDKCPFCDKQATTTNDQMIPVCLAHKKEFLDDMKCICGEELDVRVGKFGVFFSCMKCGNMNLRKVLEINPKPIPKNQTTTESNSNNYNNSSQSSSSKNKEKKHPVIIETDSNDPRFFE
jgi:hypothetical protein